MASSATYELPLLTLTTSFVAYDNPLSHGPMNVNPTPFVPFMPGAPVAPAAP
jgi:hypothetical protein